VARRAIDRELWEALVKAFTDHALNFAGAAKSAGCDARTAKRAWEEGWPKKGLPPICEEVARRAELAREERIRFEREQAMRAQELKEQQRQQIEKRRTGEEQLADMTRVNASALQKAAGNMLLVAVPMANDLLNAYKNGELNGLPPLKKTEIVRNVALILRMANETAERSIRVERIRTNVGVGAPAEAPIDLRGAAEMLADVERTLARRRALDMAESADGSFVLDGTPPTARKFDA
jgi:hypothetical protein